MRPLACILLLLSAAVSAAPTDETDMGLGPSSPDASFYAANSLYSEDFGHSLDSVDPVKSLDTLDAKDSGDSSSSYTDSDRTIDTMPAVRQDGTFELGFLQNIIDLFTGTTTTTGTTTNIDAFGGIAGSLALLAAALKAPIVALYQISAEVVVMVALILFISYLASLLGIDSYGGTGFRRRRSLQPDAPTSSNFLDTLTSTVHDALQAVHAKHA